MSDSFNQPGRCESLTDCANCNAVCYTSLSEVIIDKHCNYLGENTCAGIIGEDGRCNKCGCDYVVLARDEENAKRRGAEQYAKEHTFTPSQILNDIRMHNTDKTERTNNTFIQRYLENRHPNSPKRESLREDLDNDALNLL
jgi:hypothetical protein